MVGPSTPSRNRSNSHSSSNIYQQQNKPIRTAPLCVGCVLLLVVPVFVFNIVNTTKTLTRSDDAARLAHEELLHDVEKQPWWQNNNDKQQQTRSILSSVSSKLYQGQSWVDGSPNGGSSSNSNVVVAAETVLAKCEIHQRNGQDHLIMEEQDIIQIVVMDTQDRLWVLHHENSDAQQLRSKESPYFAIPMPSIIYSPVTGYTTNSKEAPWYAAQRIVAQVLGLLPQTTTITEHHNSNGALLDRYGIKEGKLPSSLQMLQNQQGRDSQGQGGRDVGQYWVFLGRHRTMADRGGGFVYSYLLRSVPGSPVDTDAVALSKEQVQQAIRDGHFADVRGIATVSMALLQQP